MRTVGMTIAIKYWKNDSRTQYVLKYELPWALGIGPFGHNNAHGDTSQMGDNITKADRCAQF